MRAHRLSRSTCLLSISHACLLAGAAPAWASGIPTAGGLEQIIVQAKRIGLIGESRSASEGVVPGIQLDARPVLRPGEVLEVVPGLIVTQHSGDGKANQYFLRGFNLDHGTDFATRVEGMPVNMPTHAHGQGYSDINFLIPELVEELRYRKGPYYAEHGNFSAAGSVDLVYRSALPSSQLSLTIGEDDFYRALLAGSAGLGDGTLLLGLDYSAADGPWELPQDFSKLNGLAKYTRGDQTRGFAATLMGYDGEWNSTDQIPQRAVDSRQISRFGFIDPTDGGDSHRYSLGLDTWSRRDGRAWQAQAYAIDYGLDLFSNFTYALDPDNGDQFEQFDERRIFGARGEGEWTVSLTPLAGHLRAGLEVRHDDIDPVGLYLTTARDRRDTVREDEVRQTNYSAWVAHQQHWTPWFRSELGLRGDYFDFSVRSDRFENSGDATDSIASPKLTLAFGPWAETEFFVNLGRGFHSNDARGTTITVDPTDGVTQAERVDPLVAAKGAEVGLRSAALPGLQVALSLWTLDIDSELLFVGDGGATEASRASRRKGVELGAFWTPLNWVIVDLDLAWSHARFRGDDPAGRYIPGAVETVASLGLTANHPAGWFGGARVRHFGSAPLIEDNSVRSDPTTLVNLEAGYRFTPSLEAYITVFNVLDSNDNDITYFYESRLPTEAEPVEDIHFHPVEPRTVRVTLTWRF